MSPRRLVAAVVLVLAAAGLSACTSIPRSGPVVAGESVSNDLQDGVLQAILEGPSPGQNPEQVVRGFIDAAVGFGDDHKVARSFLAPSRRLNWTPDASVQVYPSQNSWNVTSVVRGPGGTVTTRSPGTTTSPAPATSTAPAATSSPASTAETRATSATVTVTTTVTGSVDSTGRYAVAAPGTKVTRTFGLVRSDGDWRIATLDDGILVGSSDFTVTFRPFPVYFADRSGRYLVPDVHWFPANSNITGVREIPTALVSALLQGPSPYLQGAVVSGAPAGTKMAVAAVLVDDQVATVDLTEPFRRAPVKQKQLLQAQLRATLNIGGISNVQITVRRSPVDIPAARDAGAPGDPGAADGQSDTSGGPQVDPQVDDEPVVISKDKLARLSGKVLVPVADVGGLAVPGANRPAVSMLGDAYADLNGDRSQLLLQLPGAKVSTLVRGTMLTGPSFDPWGWVWTSDRASPGWVSAARPDPGQTRVKAPWLKGKSVIALRISRDGTRALVAVTYLGQAHVFVAGVVRDEDGAPVSLTQPTGLIPDLETVVDASWVDEDQIVVLGSRSGVKDQQPWLAQVGGQVKATIPLDGGQSVSAANGELGLMVGTKDGTLTRVGQKWSPISEARWAAFAG